MQTHQDKHCHLHQSSYSTPIAPKCVDDSCDQANKASTASPIEKMLVKPRTSERTCDVHANSCKKTSSAGPRDSDLIANGDLVKLPKSNQKIVRSSGSLARNAERARTTTLSKASTRSRVDTQSQAAAPSPSPEYKVIILFWGHRLTLPHARWCKHLSRIHL